MQRDCRGTGEDEAALLWLWRGRSGARASRKTSPAISSSSSAWLTEDLNRRWYQANTNTGQVLTDVQRQITHPALRWKAATLDGRVGASGAVLEAKFMLPWSFSKEAAGENTCPSSSIICLPLRREARSSRLSPAAADGSRSPPMPIRSISTLLLQPKLLQPNANSSAASKAAIPSPLRSRAAATTN